ncbi:hypothetical protein LIA77_06877 [Sarocladium implicatum]|nr:hypothetical protein LIA77_06877 [Sarocladium implicatum]
MALDGKKLSKRSDHHLFKPTSHFTPSPRIFMKAGHIRHAPRKMKGLDSFVAASPEQGTYQPICCLILATSCGPCLIH